MTTFTIKADGFQIEMLKRAMKLALVVNPSLFDDIDPTGMIDTPHGEAVLLTDMLEGNLVEGDVNHFCL